MREYVIHNDYSKSNPLYVKVFDEVKIIKLVFQNSEKYNKELLSIVKHYMTLRGSKISDHDLMVEMPVGDNKNLKIEFNKVKKDIREVFDENDFNSVRVIRALDS